jgi:uncharacterized membrane protein HdeD (DUF308 family)
MAQRMSQRMSQRMALAALDAGHADSRSQMRDGLLRAQRQIAEHWLGYLLLGCALVLAGLAAIAFPLLSTIVTKVALGWIFVLSGAAIILHAFAAGDWRGFFYNLAIGLLYLIVGGYLALLPLSSIVTLTVLLAALLIADGILEVGMAMRIRPHNGWIWVAVSGLLAMAAGALIALKLPTSAMFGIGLLIGIKMIFSGWSFIVLGLSAAKPTPTVRLRLV